MSKSMLGSAVDPESKPMCKFMSGSKRDPETKFMYKSMINSMSGSTGDPIPKDMPEYLPELLS